MAAGDVNICMNTDLDHIMGWMDLWYCIDPNAWAFIGLALALTLSIAGAAW